MAITQQAECWHCIMCALHRVCCLLKTKHWLTTVRLYVISPPALHLHEARRERASDKLWVMKTVSPPSCIHGMGIICLNSAWSYIGWIFRINIIYTQLGRNFIRHVPKIKCTRAAFRQVLTRHDTQGQFLSNTFWMICAWRRYFKSSQCTFLDTNPISIPWGRGSMQFFA